MRKYFLYNVGMNALANDPRFPIRELVQRTGVNASTLRAWESRHGLLQPERTPSGHRLYRQADVLRVKRLRNLFAQGLSLAEIVPLLEEDTVTVPADLPVVPLVPESDLGGWQNYLRVTLAALQDFDAQHLDQIYSEACSLYPIDVITTRLLIPVLHHLGSSWDTRPAGVAEEHFFSAWLRNKLGARLHHASSQTHGKHLVLACLPHENHELGLLMFALLALHRGYRVIYLGANMPLRQIGHVVRRIHAPGVVLSGRFTRDAETILEDIARLVSETTASVFVGSHFSVQAHADITRVGGIVLGDDLAVGMRQIELHMKG